MFRGLGTSRLISLRLTPPAFAHAFAVDLPAWKFCRQLCLEPATAEARRALVCLNPALVLQVFREATRRDRCKQRPEVTEKWMI
jgi:hypothetical protein